MRSNGLKDIEIFCAANVGRAVAEHYLSLE